MGLPTGRPPTLALLRVALLLAGAACNGESAIGGVDTNRPIAVPTRAAPAVLRFALHTPQPPFIPLHEPTRISITVHDTLGVEILRGALPVR